MNVHHRARTSSLTLSEGNRGWGMKNRTHARCVCASRAKSAQEEHNGAKRCMGGYLDVDVDMRMSVCARAHVRMRVCKHTAKRSGSPRFSVLRGGNRLRREIDELRRHTLFDHACEDQHFRYVDRVFSVVC
jgi:hypothetical protein